jgi:hypothetical protein
LAEAAARELVIGLAWYVIGVARYLFG